MTTTATVSALTLRAALTGLIVALLSPAAAQAGEPASFSGIYPHLVLSNEEAECGTGALVPWADRLWAITYAPHKPNGSTDKLYEIDAQLRLTVRPESVGGTPANRMIHHETQQLFLGPYVISRTGAVRVIPPTRMPGRLTGNARHLSDPARKIYYATMEEGFYEADVGTLDVTELYPDANSLGGPAGPLLPGYHGKGLYSAQGRLIYANNGEHSPEAMGRPDIPSGCLAEWDGTTWTVVRRNQFTEVTGPEGIHPTVRSADQPVWSMGWDDRSLILMMREQGRWHTFRLPKASHCYDGAHGWNTEWPRIRDVGESDLLMTMHGCFWRFPKTFSAGNTLGIAPRSTYLKVIGDFCRWNGRLVFGCDDAARSEFLNKRPAKGEVAGPGMSQSNLWFVQPDQLDKFGPALGRGAVWLNDTVTSAAPSDPFLANGFTRKSLHLAHRTPHPICFTLETDRSGNGTWTPLRVIDVPAHGSLWADLSAEADLHWIRLRPDQGGTSVTAFFTLSDEDLRPPKADARFEGVARPDGTEWSGGVVRAGSGARNALAFAATTVSGGIPEHNDYYEMGDDLKLVRVDSPTSGAWLRQHVAIPRNVVRTDDASVILEESGRRYRLPRGARHFDGTSTIPARVAREICTERDLLNVHGTFYELPAENAGGLAKVRPIATHNRLITDFCSWKGLLVLTGISAQTAPNPHIIRSDDGRCAVWLGAADDLWAFGKPVGEGGPWKNTQIRAGTPSDPYLMTGYDRKSLSLSHDSTGTVQVAVEADVTGDGLWLPYRTFAVPSDAPLIHTFPPAFSAYWIRTISDSACRATAWLEYR